MVLFHLLQRRIHAAGNDPHRGGCGHSVPAAAAAEDPAGRAAVNSKKQRNPRQTARKSLPGIRGSYWILLLGNDRVRHMADGELRHIDRLCPFDGVGDDLLHLRHVVDGEGLVAGLEVEDLAATAVEAAAAAEDFAALKPADEHEVVRCGDVEVFAVGLLVRDDDLFLETVDDGMGGIHDPHDHHLVVFSPLEVEGGGAADLVEDLGSVAGVQHDEAHAVLYTLVYALHDLVGDLMVCHVAPPDEHVGVLEHFLGEAVFRLTQGSGLYVHAGFFQEIGDAAMDARGVNRRDFGHFQFVQIFIPNRNFCCHRDILSAVFSLWIRLPRKRLLIWLHYSGIFGLRLPFTEKLSALAGISPERRLHCPGKNGMMDKSQSAAASGTRRRVFNHEQSTEARRKEHGEDRSPLQNQRFHFPRQ